MKPVELIDKVLSGESVKDVIDEITKTASIARYPKPMGVVRNSRKNKKDD